MQGRQKATFADHERSAMRFLLRQKPRRGLCAYKYMMFHNIDPQPLQAGGDVTPGSLAVVCQKEERNVGHTETVDELICPGNKVPPAVDHFVHVDQISKHRNTVPRTQKQSRRRSGRMLRRPL